MQTKLMFSPEDSHANPTQWQESDLAKKMTVTSGQKCLESLEKLNPDGSLARMFSALLIGMEGWYSTKCKLTWKLKGTKYSRMYCQLYPSMLPIEETEFGLLPTPRATTIEENVNGWQKRMDKRIEDGLTIITPNLHILAMKGMLPTPTAMDSTNATATMKSTQVKQGSMHSVTLTRALSMGLIPTPMASDCGEKITGLENQDSLMKMTREITGKPSQLSPQFVMEMMGFPTDWTLLPFLNGERNQLKPEVTQ
jgi:hypothetical protein